MNLGHWVRDKIMSRSVHEDKYERAIQLADEVSGTIKDRTTGGDPFTVIALDLLRLAVSDGGVDPALVAEAFEIQQEAKIYRGPS